MIKVGERATIVMRVSEVAGLEWHSWRTSKAVFAEPTMRADETPGRVSAEFLNWAEWRERPL